MIEALKLYNEIFAEHTGLVTDIVVKNYMDVEYATPLIRLYPTTTIQDLEMQRECQASLLRDIVGNLFRPVSVSSDWRTPTVTSLAKAAYEERMLPAGHLEVDRLCILADALEDAGCTEATILEHLRGPGPHVRGCWLRFVDYQYRSFTHSDSSSRSQAESG